MGLVALAALWVNMCLVAADAWRRRSRLGAQLAELRASRLAGSLVRATIVDGAGEKGVFATSVVEQLGRAMTVPGPRRILFTDRARRSHVAGGTARAGELTISVQPASVSEVWSARESILGSGEDVAAFDRAWEPASTFKGFSRTLEHRLGPGDEVWLWLEAPPERGRASARLVAGEDPELSLARARGPLSAVIVVSLGGLALVTSLALWPPALGHISMLGAVGGLALFLGAPPLGTAARDRALLPSQQRVGGTWQRP